MLLYERLSKYISFEVHPVLALDQFGHIIGPEAFKRVAAVELEQCSEDDPDIYCWSVYGRILNAGIECIADCPTKELAESIVSALCQALRPEVV